MEAGGLEKHLGHVVEHVLEERVCAEERSADSAAVLAAGGV